MASLHSLSGLEMTSTAPVASSTVAPASNTSSYSDDRKVAQSHVSGSDNHVLQHISAVSTWDAVKNSRNPFKHMKIKFKRQEEASPFPGTKTPTADNITSSPPEAITDEILGHAPQRADKKRPVKNSPLHYSQPTKTSMSKATPPRSPTTQYTPLEDLSPLLPKYAQSIVPGQATPPHTPTKTSASNSPRPRIKLKMTPSQSPSRLSDLGTTPSPPDSPSFNGGFGSPSATTAVPHQALRRSSRTSRPTERGAGRPPSARRAGTTAEKSKPVPAKIALEKRSASEMVENDADGQKMQTKKARVTEASATGNTAPTGSDAENEQLESSLGTVQPTEPAKNSSAMKKGPVINTAKPSPRNNAASKKRTNAQANGDSGDGDSEQPEKKEGRREPPKKQEKGSPNGRSSKDKDSEPEPEAIEEEEYDEADTVLYFAYGTDASLDYMREKYSFPGPGGKKYQKFGEKGIGKLDDYVFTLHKDGHPKVVQQGSSEVYGMVYSIPPDVKAKIEAKLEKHGMIMAEIDIRLMKRDPNGIDSDWYAKLVPSGPDPVKAFTGIGEFGGEKEGREALLKNEKKHRKMNRAILNMRQEAIPETYTHPVLRPLIPYPKTPYDSLYWDPNKKVVQKKKYYW